MSETNSIAVGGGSLKDHLYSSIMKKKNCYSIPNRKILLFSEPYIYLPDIADILEMQYFYILWKLNIIVNLF